MKKLLAILLAILMCTSLLAAAHAATISVARSKMSDELLAAFDAKDAGETVTAIVEMKDVDHDEVMATFAKMYPEEFATYIRAKFDNLEETEFADVLLSKEFSQYSTGDIDGEVLQRAIEYKREIYKSMYSSQNTSSVDALLGTKNIQYVSSYAPMAIVELTEANAINISLDSHITSIDYYDNMTFSTSAQNEVYDFDRIRDAIVLANSITRADYVRDTKGNTGTGVKIGIVEAVGIPDISNEYLTSSSLIIRPGDTGSDDHATAVALILAGKGPNGVSFGLVPNAQLYCAHTPNYSTFVEAIEWMISSGVNVINGSLENASNYGTYDNMSKWVDHIAAQHDIHCVFVSGNDPDAMNYFVSSPGIAYNAITVGAFHPNGSDNVAGFTMADYSRYNEYLPAAEKPNLVAPGYFHSTTSGSISGTSFAAPHVTGTIAQMCGYNTSLKTKQALIGAVLAASSAEKVQATGNGLQGDTVLQYYRAEGSHKQISRIEGAGILDARWARGIIQYGNAWGYTIAKNAFPYTKMSRSMHRQIL